jgi:hypothetical protein
MGKFIATILLTKWVDERVPTGVFYYSSEVGSSKVFWGLSLEIGTNRLLLHSGGGD